MTASQDLSRWQPPPRPPRAAVEGAHVRLEPLEADLHAADLHRAFSGHERLWTWLPYGPFVSAGAYHRWVKETASGEDPLFFALRDRATGHCGGVCAWLRVAPEAGSIEVGHICLAPELARRRPFTEAMWLMLGWAFAAGYRRVEWKCDAANLASRRAAQRFGFSFEGVFRNHLVVKRRNRDTAWFSVIDREWPGLDEAFRAWLQEANFDAAGRQRERLSDLTRLARSAHDPALGSG